MKLPAFHLNALLSLSFICFNQYAVASTFTGTGVFISTNGYIATNFHVINSGGYITARDGAGRIHQAEVVLRDKVNDLAILKVQGTSFDTLPIRNSNSVKKGTTVFTLGFPNVTTQGRESKVTDGVISSLSGLGGEPNSFQISVPIQPGNSGGPLIDMSGSIVGLTTAKLSASVMLNRSKSLPENVNYAVKSNYLLELLNTDKNILKSISARKLSTKLLPLPDLVGLAEKAVVFILIDDQKQPPLQTPGNEIPVNVPKYERDAKAIELYQKGNTAIRNSNYQEAIVFLGKAADMGNAKAQNNLGMIYADGLGVSKDEVEAMRWFRKAADQGLPDAQYNLGLRYGQGKGVAKDDAEAVRWYRKAADQGNASAQINLGWMYAEGRAVPKDDAEAMRWFRKAADQGHAMAQNNLGWGYFAGRGVAKDEVEAVRWYRKAADQGLRDAQDALKRLGQ